MTQLESQVSQATHRLAEFVVETSYEDLPTATIERGNLAIADTIGVALRGSVEPEMNQLYERFRGANATASACGATVFRRGFPRLEASAAALLNATAVCFLELDEGSRPTGHPAVHILPSALAFAQEHKLSGKTLLKAFVLGYEVQGRLQKSSQLRRIVHPHGNYGLVAAVAALGKLSNWTVEQMYQGLLNASALVMGTSWQPCIMGGTVRNAYTGITAQTAFTVARLVEAGFTGYQGAFAETFGEILGEGFTVEPLIANLGESYCIEENYFKFHAACALTHPVLDATADAVAALAGTGTYPTFTYENGVDPEQIADVEVRVLERSLRLDVHAQPNQLSSKFSIPFAVATFLVNKSTGPDSFSGEALTEERTLRLEQRVRVVGDATMSDRWPAEHPAEVIITMQGGEIFKGTCSNPFGSITNEASAADLKAKFESLTGLALERTLSQATWESLVTISDILDLSTLFR